MKATMESVSSMEVTLVSGLAGVGKTSLARSLTSDSRASVRERPAQPPIMTSDDAVDLAESLLTLASLGQRGPVVVELAASTDTAEVGLVLETMFSSHADERSARLTNIVTVASVSDIRRLLFRDGWSPVTADEYNEPERLANQLEFATTIVLADALLAPEGILREVRTLLAKLNPWATAVSLESAKRHPHRTRSQRRNPAHGLAASAGWMLELSGRGEVPTTTEGISAMVFRDPRPFHPERLALTVATSLDPAQAGLVVRSRGLVRLATRSANVGSWASAGEVLSIDPTSMTSWDPESPTGQEIVFFGRDMNHRYLESVLGECLLTDDELVAGPSEWSRYADPFPGWEPEHHH
ncbi:MAG: GTP-binding protein [Salinibacterium sp.]|nr:GTP-binding protein [Salinibacterium sp.]